MVNVTETFSSAVQRLQGLRQSTNTPLVAASKLKVLCAFEFSLLKGDLGLWEKMHCQQHEDVLLLLWCHMFCVKLTMMLTLFGCKKVKGHV